MFVRDVVLARFPVANIPRSVLFQERIPLWMRNDVVVHPNPELVRPVRIHHRVLLLA